MIDCEMHDPSCWGEIDRKEKKTIYIFQFLSKSEQFLNVMKYWGCNNNLIFIELFQM